jgi:nickel/cobalt exporter
VLVLASTSLVVPAPSFAQGARHPFAVGADEGAASIGDPVSRFILALEGSFYRLLTGAVRAARDNVSATWSLVALSFAYGVVHAAGPGHGKAVIASYVVANEQALRRGVAISAAAAMLQGSVAVAIVGAAAMLFQATSKQMTYAASIVEIVSYAGITLLGGVLVYKKAKALRALHRTAPLAALEPAFAVAAVSPDNMPLTRGTNRRFSARDASLAHEHGPSCGHLLAFDPRLDSRAHGWKATILTVLAAGLRPCSGAILVLFFAVAQGVLVAGILAVAAMSLGTAITTAALAAFAVLGKHTAAKLAAGSKRALLIGRAIEATAAVGVLLLGLVLLAASLYRAI